MDVGREAILLGSGRPVAATGPSVPLMADGQARIGEDGRAAVGAKRNGHAFSVFVVG